MKNTLPTWQNLQKRLLQAGVLLLILSFLTNLAALSLPIYTLQIFDRVLLSSSKDTLLMLAIALAITSIAYIGFDALRKQVPIIIARFIEKIYANPLLIHNLKLLSKSSDNNQLKIDKIKSFFSNPALFAALDLIWAPLFIAILFFINPWFGALLLISNSLFLIICIAQNHVVKKSSKELLSQQKITYQQNNNLLKNKEVMLAMGMCDNWLEETKPDRKHLAKLQKSLNKQQQTFLVLSNCARWMTQASLPTLGAILLIEQIITPGAMLAALIIGNKSIAPFEPLLNHWQSLKQAYACLLDLKSSLTQDNFQSHYQIKSTMPHTPPMLLKGNISSNNLKIFAGDKDSTILQQVNFSLAAGETLAIIGPNGAGKSLFMKSLLGLHQQRSGRINLDNTEISQLDKMWLGHQCGYVPQYIQLPKAKVSAIICRHQSVNKELLIQAARLAGISDIILTMPNGYETLIGEDAHPVSPGIAQRIALARAFYAEPQYIFLDEADAFLDHQGSKFYAQAIIAAKEKGQTLIFITQRRTSLALADKVILLDKKQQMFYDTPNGISQLSQVTATGN